MMILLIKISTLLTFTFSLTLGIYTLYINPKNRINQLWFLSNIAVAIWAVGYYLSFTSLFESQALFAQKITYIGVIFIPIFLFHFVILFVRFIKVNKIYLYIGYGLAIFFIILLFKTKLLLEGVFYNEGCCFDEIRGKLFIFYLIYFFFYIIYSLYILAKLYLKSDGIIKKQSLYMLVAILISAIGGSTNYLTEMFFIPPYGQLITFLYPVIITYAIFLKKY